MADEDQTPIDETPEEQQVRDRQLLDTLGREKELAVLRDLLQHEPLRDFLWRILAQCRVYGSVYNRNFGDFALAEGGRQIGLWLLSEICEADPTAEMAMRQKSLAIAHAQAREDREKKLQRGRRKT